MNPRPKHFDDKDYILSLFMFLLMRHQKTGLHEIAFSTILSIHKARIDRFQPYMTPDPELG